ncbi:MYND zinc finger (ZnF) domain-like protein [Angomonas deanei]|nr:MYND zinc finger (ZnF) domain-like protein [Angomonas deanei]|eukprot:EPY27008.1 MYND zinc finger (ZnF) domain-like protein [Angomonas deanei]
MEDIYETNNNNNGKKSIAYNNNNTDVALEKKLNELAELNLLFLAQLPWFVPMIDLIINGGDKNNNNEENENNNKTSSNPSREELRRKLKEKQKQRQDPMNNNNEMFNEEELVKDDDVVIALTDLRAALPIQENKNENTTEIKLSEANIEQAKDLLFLDASTTLLHLTPLVSRCYSDTCANCNKMVIHNNNNNEKLLRCSSCKSVFYCSAACQKKHWTTAHKTACLSYKEKVEWTAQQYNSKNNNKNKNKNKEFEILEVPIEPTLFYETRHYLFDHRDESFRHVNFYDYFMKYSVKGS